MERFPEEQDLVVVWDFVCEGEAYCRPNSPTSWKPFVIMALHGLKSERQEHIAADCAMRSIRDGEAAVMRAASAARTRREFRHALEAQWSEASLHLQQVAYEASLAPPGNDLKEYDGAWHVRINDQWRLSFKWGESGPYDVLIEDPH